MNKKTKIKLDPEEQALLDSFDKGEWKSVSNLKQAKEKAKKAAHQYQKKNARINIRLSTTDLDQIKQRAIFEGMPYQTLISSVLHKYAAGHLNLHRDHDVL